eukprot:TRINITY_DN8196_c0_g1_i1.p1 TRINITY_DN8196_c0_g1~~TRINITY_DN8196_c0_g1_i1.p1  ORF type:complete len:342 (+),score=20.26 TRINITY_DN8196_c0_g1_i1:85-1026(+)
MSSNNMSKPFGITLDWRDTIAGIAAGVTTVVLLHPIDVVKIRLQVSDGTGSGPVYRNTAQAIQTIWRAEGVRGLYAGIVPSILASGVSWGLYWTVYQAFKARSSQNSGDWRSHFSSAVQASMMGILITNPLWVVRTRLMLQVRYRGLNSGAQEYHGIVHCFYSIARKEGIKGFYKGIVPALMLSLNPTLQFTAYEQLKRLGEKLQLDKQSGGFDTLGYGAMAKLCSSGITYPLQVIRSRLQQRLDGKKMDYRNIIAAVRITLRREGWRGLYKGFLANVLRTMPQASLQFFTYEMVRSGLDKLVQKKGLEQQYQ